MKILHVLVSRVSLPPPKYGGTQRVIWSLAQAQRAQGHEVRFLWGDAPQVPAGTIVAMVLTNATALAETGLVRARLPQIILQFSVHCWKMSSQQ